MNLRVILLFAFFSTLNIALAEVKDDSAHLRTHLDTIASLKSEEWVNLGSPQPDPHWGKARGRAWTSKMAFAPELNAAFLYGEGIHGWWNEKTGRYMDDLWIYDVTNHAWTNLYPGFNALNPPHLDLTNEGFITADYELVPIAPMVHGYDMTLWDKKNRKFVFMACPGVYWSKSLPSVVQFKKENKNKLFNQKSSPWVFDFGKKKWEKHAIKGPAPKSNFGDSFVYIDDTGEYFFRETGNGKVWFYNPERNRWRESPSHGTHPSFGIEANSCYDSKRKRVYIGGGRFPIAGNDDGLWIYDLNSNSWVNPKPKGSSGGSLFSTANAALHCDTKNDVVILFRFNGNSRGVYSYDPEQNEWRHTASSLPWQGGQPDGAINAFYNTIQNAHFFHVAGDSKENGTIWVYRYK